jgi:hypothetical protein
MKTLESGSPKKTVNLVRISVHRHYTLNVQRKVINLTGRLLVLARQEDFVPNSARHKISPRGLRLLIPSLLIEDNPPTCIHQAALEMG